jgi:hypothetical protein
MTPGRIPRVSRRLVSGPDTLRIQVWTRGILGVPMAPSKSSAETHLGEAMPASLAVGHRGR